VADGGKQERETRQGMWNRLLEANGPLSVPPNLLRDLGIYGGAQGVWVDQARTSTVTSSRTGITVGLLHTGVHYADDLAADGVIYHYPKTNRPPSRDLSEINATKEAKRLQVPVFVITRSPQNASLRDVYRGWIEDWDDEAGAFLIPFRDSPPKVLASAVEEAEPFQVTSSTKRNTVEVLARPGQARFKFQVFKRYGQECAVCDIHLPELLDAAHIVSKRQRGSDDPRNGLVLCATHHRAFDSSLFAIEPDSTKIRFRSSGPTDRELNVTRNDLSHLRHRPHWEALEWAWNRWNGVGSEK
jgi:putative restriction endonuclease